MEEKALQTEWTGRQGRIGAWFLASPWRRWSEVFIGQSRAALLEEVGSLLREDEVVLDAGCGSGYLSLPIAGKLTSGTVLCLDLSDEMLSSLEKRAGKAGLTGRIRVVKAPAEASGLDDASVDWVICNNVLHELSDVDACIEEWARVLRAGGHMALSDFRATRPFKFFMSHRHGEEAHGPFATQELEALLEKKGLKEVKAVPYRHTLLATAVR